MLALLLARAWKAAILALRYSHVAFAFVASVAASSSSSVGRLIAFVAFVVSY